MSSTAKRWRVFDRIPDRTVASLAQYHHVIVQCLVNRGIIDPEHIDPQAVSNFLDRPAQFRDPFGLRDMAAAVKRIRAAIRRGERIIVYGDFDADGVTASVLLVQTLKALGADVGSYIPNRVDEGYGLNCGALDRIVQDGAVLVVTVDCGIRSAPEVAYGQSLGLDMIVTDHHSVQQDAQGRDILPPAVAVINSKRQDDAYAFKGLAGVGLAFKLAQGLMRAELRDPVSARPLTLKTSDLLDLVALGTVADIAPLVDENRFLVQRGLIELNRPRRPGIKAMLDEAGLQKGKITSHSIGFRLGPRLNAAGRLASADLSYNLLMAEDGLTADRYALELARLNTERQELTQQAVELAKAQIDEMAHERFFYLIEGHGFNHGIVGLVAGRLTEALYRPTAVAEVGEAETRGSARSIPDFDVTRALDECRDLLVRHGGHAAAAGFTVKNENLPELRRKMEAIAEAELKDKELTPLIDIDAELDLVQPDMALLDLLGQLEPFGEGNAQPLFVTYGAHIVPNSLRRFGREAQHLGFRVTVPGSRTEWDVVAWRMAELSRDLPGRIDMVYALEPNEYNGRRRAQLTLRDLKPANEQGYR